MVWVNEGGRRRTEFFGIGRGRRGLWEGGLCELGLWWKELCRCLAVWKEIAGRGLWGKERSEGELCGGVVERQGGIICRD